MSLIYGFDETILMWIQENLRNGFTDKFFSVITYVGEKGIFWILVGIVLLFFPKTRKCGTALRNKPAELRIFFMGGSTPVQIDILQLYACLKPLSTKKSAFQN